MEIRKLFDLQIGDRFYFLDDKQRNVWQVDFIELTTRINSFNKEESRTYVHYKNDLNVIKKEAKNRQVVFVRSAG